MKKRLAMIGFMVVALFMAGIVVSCSKPSNRAEYSFGGSTTLEPIMVSATEAYSPSHPDIKISYDAQGSSVGIKGVIDGIYALGGASRELKDEEKAEGAMETPIALDGIAIIINGDVQIKQLSLEQIAKIFTGDIKNWEDVGGADIPIVVINRDEASGTRSAFQELVLDKVYGKEKEVNFLAESIVTDSNGDMVTKVSSTSGGIGYAGFGYIGQVKEAGANAISIDGVEPTVKNVINTTYPISRKLNVIHKGELKEGSLEKDFVNFILSDDGQTIVEEQGFIKIPKE